MELRMKKSGRKVLSVILTAVMVFALLPIISFPIKAKAEWGIDNGLEYEIVGDEVFIRKYDDSDSELVIPAQIEGISKISISSGAFTDCHNLESVVSNGNVGDIGENAFYCCDNLNRVVFNGNVGNIGYGTFYECRLLKSIVFNGNVGNIGDSAFYGCSSLESVEFKGNVGDIEYAAFKNCKNLGSIEIKGDTRNIGDSAFYGCANLKSVEVEGKEVNIGNSAFHGCNKLESVEFKGNIGNIGKYAFYGCSKIESVVFNGNVGNIGDSAFTRCSSFKRIEFKGNVGDIEEKAFYYSSSLESVEFNGNVGNIGDSAFYGCSNLESVEFKENVGDIGHLAFSECGNLKNILIPSTSMTETDSFSTNIDVIKFDKIEGKKFIYTGKDLSEEVCKSIIGKIPQNDEFKLLFYKGENEVNEVKNIGDYTAELLLKEYNNSEEYTSLLKTNFTVEMLNISDSTVNVEISSDTFMYNREDQNNQIKENIKVEVVGRNSYLPSDNYIIEFSNDGGNTFSENLVCKNVGAYQARIVAKGSNCTGEVSGVKFSIIPKKLTIIAKSVSKDCDGITLEFKEYDVEGLIGSDSIKSINISGSQTGPGSCENVASDPVIVNAAGEDATDCYDITYKNGTLKVNAHIFDQEVATNEYLAVDATFTSPSKYYKSCLCGEKGEETFEAGDPLPTYTITFEANGGVVDIEVNGTNEEYKLDSLPTPTYEGYDFKGWYTNATGGTEITTDTVFGTNMTIYAHWEKIEEPKPAQDENSENPEKPEDPEEPQEPEEPEEPEIPEKDWLDDLWLALRIADELGGAQTVEYCGDFALSYDIMTYLVEHPSITFVYHVKYEDVEYTIIIPAGKAVSSPEIPWYGPLWLLANYGNGN